MALLFAGLATSACQGTLGNDSPAPPSNTPTVQPTPLPAPAPAPTPTYVPPAPAPTPAPVVTPPAPAPTPTPPPPAPIPEPVVTPPAPVVTPPPPMVIPPPPVVTPPPDPRPVTPPPPVGRQEVGFVVRDANNLSQEEDDLLNFMDDIGFISTPIDQNERSRDFRDLGVIVISAGVDGRQLADEWDTNQPVMVLNPDTMVEMEMVQDRGNQSGTQNVRELEIEDDGHPIARAVGLRGRFEVSNQNLNVNFGTPERDADIVATINNDRRRAAIYVYEPGTDLARNNNNRQVDVRSAKNRRVGFFLRENAFNDLNRDGEDLFEATLNYTYSGNATVGGGL